MKQLALSDRKYSCGRLVRCGLCLLAFVLSGSAVHSVSARQPVSVTLKVCVADESGNPVDVKLTLYNASGRIDQKKDGCYKSQKLSLDPDKFYFVAALSDKRGVVAPLPVSLADEGKEIALPLKLGGPTPAINPAIEVCLKSENNAPVVIKGVLPVDGASFAPENAAAGCFRVRTVAAPEYKLTLATGAAAPPSGRLRNVALLLLALGYSALTAMLLFKLRKVPTNTATQESVVGLDTKLNELLGKADQVVSTVAKLGSAAPPPSSGGAADARKSKTEDLEPHPKELTNKPPQDLPAPPDSHAPAVAAFAEAVSEEDRSRSVAKQQYRSFSNGEGVEHFYLMPSGASNAANMIEDSWVELREQNNGTYVAFRSRSKENEGWVFPMPNTHFTSETFKALFPELTSDQYDSGNIDPKPVVLLVPKLWKLNG
jgi:hypothetical protein